MSGKLSEAVRAARRGWKFLVIGDVMLDVYVHGDATRMSPEEPAPIFDAERISTRPGGAANTAVNLARLGNSVVLLGRGEQQNVDSVTFHSRPAALLLKDALSDCGVRHYLAPTPGYQTELKVRYVARGRPAYMFRCDWRTPADNDALTALVSSTLKEEPFDAVVVSDYAKGATSAKMAKDVLMSAFEQNIPVYIDCRPDQLPVWFQPGASSRRTLKLNEKEFNDAGGSVEDGMPSLQVKHCGDVCRAADVELLVTKGDRGMFVWSSTMLHGFDIAGRPSAEFKSSIGAGDTALAVYAWGRTIGLESGDAAFVANAAASEVVKHAENGGLSKDELIDVLEVAI